MPKRSKFWPPKSGKLKPVKNRAREMARYRKAAEATFAKDSRINIRISSKDLRALQKRALAEGMPYQTLVSSVLHKFVEGQIVEQSESKRPPRTRERASVKHGAGRQSG